MKIGIAVLLLAVAGFGQTGIVEYPVPDDAKERVCVGFTAAWCEVTIGDGPFVDFSDAPIYSRYFYRESLPTLKTIPRIHYYTFCAGFSARGCDEIWPYKSEDDLQAVINEAEQFRYRTKLSAIVEMGATREIAIGKPLEFGNLPYWSHSITVEAVRDRIIEEKK